MRSSVRHRVHLTAHYVLEQTHCRARKPRFPNAYLLPSLLNTTKGKEWQELAAPTSSSYSGSHLPSRKNVTVGHRLPNLP